MRIAGYIEHPRLKITIFQMENKYTVKFENEQLEQSYKLRQGDTISNIDSVRQFFDEDFIADVEQLFAVQSQLLQLKLIEVDTEEDDFDEII